MRKSPESTSRLRTEHLPQPLGRGDLLKCYSLIWNSLVRFDDVLTTSRKGRANPILAFFLQVTAEAWRFEKGPGLKRSSKAPEWRCSCPFLPCSWLHTPHTVPGNFCESRASVLPSQHLPLVFSPWMWATEPGAPATCAPPDFYVGLELRKQPRASHSAKNNKWGKQLAPLLLPSSPSGITESHTQKENFFFFFFK